MKNKQLFKDLNVLPPPPHSSTVAFFAAFIKASNKLISHFKVSIFIFTGFTEKARNGFFSKINLYPGITSIQFRYLKTNIT